MKSKLNLTFKKFSLDLTMSILIFLKQADNYLQ